MSYGKVKKTEKGHDKSPAGKCWGGRKTVKPIAKKVRRLNEKKIVQEAIKGLGE